MGFGKLVCRWFGRNLAHERSKALRRFYSIRFRSFSEHHVQGRHLFSIESRHLRMEKRRGQVAVARNCSSSFLRASSWFILPGSIRPAASKFGRNCRSVCPEMPQRSSCRREDVALQ
jgi:hypothetical protein